MSATDTDQANQRLDQWLWHARIFKTRTLASKFANDGKVRVTRDDTTTRIEKASFLIKPGDTLSFTRGEQLRVIEILRCAKRRGPASEASSLYADHSPPPPKKEKRPAPPFAREQGAGRPTKKERREIDALKSI